MSNFRVFYLPTEGEWVALTAAHPFLSWFAQTPGAAASGLRRLVEDIEHGRA